MGLRVVLVGGAFNGQTFEFTGEPTRRIDMPLLDHTTGCFMTDQYDRVTDTTYLFIRRQNVTSLAAKATESIERAAKAAADAAAQTRTHYVSLAQEFGEAMRKVRALVSRSKDGSDPRASLPWNDGAVRDIVAMRTPEFESLLEPGSTAMEFYSQCHPEARYRGSYDATEKAVLLACDQCFSLVAKIRVAEPTADSDAAFMARGIERYGMAFIEAVRKLSESA